MIIAIASSDGNFDLQEQRVASKIATELGLAPSEFGLG
jgi:tellurite resistance protein TerB